MSSVVGGMTVNPNDIIWYTVEGGIETQVGTGLTYEVQPGDAGKEIVSKVIVNGNTLANSSAGNIPNLIVASGDIDASFNIGTGFNGGVSSITIQADGKIIVGGSFSEYKGVGANYIIRLNSDGSRDNSFNIGTGFNNIVLSTAIQSDGKVIVGGRFTSYHGLGANYIVRLNSDGSRDSSFNIGAGFNFSVETTAIQSDGKVIVGGRFTLFQGLTANRIIRLNSNGSRDTSFNIGSGFTNDVETIAIQSDGKVIVGGNFTSYRGLSALRIARLNSDGSRDSSFNIGTGFNNWVYTTAIQSDGKVIVGGLFNTYQGVSALRIARLDSDGSIDTSFNIGIGFNWSVDIIGIQSDSKVIVGGGFTSYQDSPAGYLTRLMP